MSSVPDIWFRPEVRSVTVSLGIVDGKEKFKTWQRSEDEYCLVIQDCTHGGVRNQLLSKGGTEAMGRKWYLAEDCSGLTIPQWDGTQHSHKPDKDGAFECDSPACNAFLMESWERTFPRESRVALNEHAGRPVAAPQGSTPQRPVSLVDWNKAHGVGLTAKQFEQAQAVERDQKLADAITTGNKELAHALLEGLLSKK